MSTENYKVFDAQIIEIPEYSEWQIELVKGTRWSVVKGERDAGSIEKCKSCALV